ncbi:BTAD domain-containing putative transcriptional regulator [Pseudonocardia sp. Cha107L01]|uniref:BTAD domain-containing putative transcriptional regulator n=1 Tax=Pseudonocardia sp. Cha107L01 TaxID=3457576 RepID=UPI00403EBFBF
MQFRILGTLEVTADGEPVALGGPKPRALLAALLLRPGAAVSTDRLVEAVWGDAPPPNALSALRAYVSRLRTVLGSVGGAERLRYRAPGYVLALADGELDAAEFARLISLARGPAATAEYEQVVQLLDTALGLWRDDPLAEFAHLDFVGAAASRLADLRLTAIEERADALLRLGRGSEVVAELAALFQTYPERERLAVLLMRGLYGCGRQADALAVYQELRRRLVGDLGVEPSEPARALQRQMLTHDPALVPPRSGPPSNLPRRASSLIGRDDEIRRVTAAMRDASMVTLTGVGGVGKSRLALEAAGQDRSRFPDGVWLCELAPLADGGPVSHAVAVALRVQQRHGLTIEQTVIEYLRVRKLLLVMDNCEHVLDAASRLLDRVVSHCPDVVVLATSREALGVEGEQVWPLPPLSVDDATALFVQRARAARPDFHPDHEIEGSVAEICRRLDGLPLAIELAAARMRVMSAAEVARRLDDGRLLARGSSAAQPRHQSLTAAIDWSYRLLSEPEQRLFARLSVFAGGADLAAVHAVCAEPGRSEADTLDLLAALVDKSMVVAAGGPGGTRYRVLETLRAYGRERRPAGGSLADRHAEYYTELAEQAALGVQGPDERIWVERTLPDQDNLRAAFERTVADRNPDLAMRLVTSLPEVSHIRVGYEAAGWAERALELTSESHPLFVAGVGAAARGAWNVGDFARARRLVARAGGRVPDRGTARSGYPADVAADVGLYEGDVDPALRHYEAQVLLARRDDDPIRLVWTLYYVAICHAVRRAPELGLPAARECRKVAEATANPTAVSMARYALGLVLKKSDPDQALALFDEAAALAASVHNFWWSGIALMEAASTRAVHGEPAVAARALIDVLDHWDRVGDRTQQWLNLRYVVRLLVRLGADYDAVVLHHCLLAAAKPSPLDASRAAGLAEVLGAERFAAARSLGSGLSAAAAVAVARSCLRRSC